MACLIFLRNRPSCGPLGPQDSLQLAPCCQHHLRGTQKLILRFGFLSHKMGTRFSMRPVWHKEFCYIWILISETEYERSCGGNDTYRKALGHRIVLQKKSNNRRNILKLFLQRRRTNVKLKMRKRRTCIPKKQEQKTNDAPGRKTGNENSKADLGVFTLWYIFHLLTVSFW